MSTDTRTLDKLSDTERKAAAFDRMIAGLAAIEAELQAIPDRTFADRHAAFLNSVTAILSEIHRAGYNIPVHVAGAMRRVAQSRPAGPDDVGHYAHTEKICTTRAGEPGEPSQRAEAELLRKALKIKLSEFLRKSGLTPTVADHRVANELSKAGMPTKPAQMITWRKEAGRAETRAPGLAARLEEAEGIIGAAIAEANGVREAVVAKIIGGIIDL